MKRTTFLLCLLFALCMQVVAAEAFLYAESSEADSKSGYIYTRNVGLCTNRLTREGSYGHLFAWIQPKS